MAARGAERPIPPRTGSRYQARLTDCCSSSCGCHPQRWTLHFPHDFPYAPSRTPDPGFPWTRPGTEFRHRLAAFL